ncbi:MAG: alpha/beta hydrolase [Bdellovibrionaceae bacterium]|nr:alpha/beta hydrolase [Pseudobdellovibrionaceae bacterium]
MNDIIKQTGTFPSFDGTPIYYEVRGSGRPIFLCYGLACLMNHWTHQVRHFSERYQTILLDYRGHHRSPAPQNRSDLTLDALCLDIKGLADHLEIRHASFWGHSLGVQILLRLYDMHPELVSNFVFINGFASNPIQGMFGTNAVSTLFELMKEGHKMWPEVFAFLWRKGVENPLSIPLSALAGGFNLNLTSLKDIEVYARGVAAMDLSIFLTLFEEMMNYDATPVLDRIQVPTLIISGNKDGVTPTHHQDLMHDLIRGSQILKVPYGSHCTQLDLPEFVNLRIDRFLDELHYR